MTRLPTSGADNGIWGDVLNDFLVQVHTADGQLKQDSVNTQALVDDAVTIAKLATASAPSNGQVLSYSGTDLTWATPASAPDASTSAKGIVQLAGDLSGTASTPTVPALSNKVAKGDLVWNVKDYGAIGDGTTNDTAAIQATLDAAAAGTGSFQTKGGIVYVPSGVYNITQIVIPACVRLQGAGWHGFSTNTTMLKHTTAQIIDMILFQGNSDGFAGPCGISDIQLLGHPSSTGGCGINSEPGTGSITSLAKLQDSSTFERIFIRGFAEDGFRITGCSPARLSMIATLWNGGYGIKVVDDGGQDPIGKVHLVTLDNISCDGNSGGAAIRIEGMRVMASVVINGIKSEQRDNADRGGSNKQPNVLQVNDCLGSVSVNGLMHISSASTTTKPGDAIVVSGSNKPTISWFGANIRDLASQTSGATPNMLSDSTVTLPKTAAYGCYTAGNGTRFGDPAGVRPSIATNYLGVGGALPMLGLWETDAATDEKSWGINAQSGVLYMRTHSDAGAPGTTWLQVVRTGNSAAAAQFGVPVTPTVDNTTDLGNGVLAWRTLYAQRVRFKEGTNKWLGVATLVGGTVTVANTSVTASSRIFLTINTPGGTVGTPYVSARVAGASFTITSTSASDTSTVAWVVIEPF